MAYPPLASDSPQESCRPVYINRLLNRAITRQTVNLSKVRGPLAGSEAPTGIPKQVRHELSMPRYDFRTPRLYVDAPLGTGGEVALAPAQAHYLRNVLRLKAGDPVLVFNGRDG